MLIDAHCHIDLFPNPHEVAARAEQAGVRVVSVTTTPAAYEITRQIGDRHGITTALGIHPELVAERTRDLELFSELVPDVRWVGEVGLDRTARTASTFDRQVDVFSEVLRLCATHGGRMLSIHSRGAAGQVLDLIEKSPESGTFVLHWFSGTVAAAKRAAALGCWFSINEMMLRSVSGRRLLAVLPRNRVLTETDAPFAEAKGAALRPEQVSNTVALLAAAWCVDFEAAKKLVAGNFARISTERD
jgi:TatD DNase family protein